MAILVTGGAGYIGSHTVLALLERGEEVVVLDNLSNSSEESLHRVEQLTGKTAVFYQGDILDEQCLKRIFDAHQITSVIHFAGLKAVGESTRKPLEYYQNNVAGTLVLLQAMRDAGVHQFIFSSSATVYGTPEHTPLVETSRVGGTTNPYGTSKLMVEQILQDFAAAEPQFAITALRYFNPVGAHESGMIGEDPNGIPNNLLPYIAQVAIGKLEKLSVFGDDYPTADGTGVRDYIHVMDLAEGHLKAIDHITEGFTVYNLGTGKGYSVLEMVAAFEDASGRKVSYQIVPRRPGDIAECWSDPALAAEKLDWRAKRNLNEMMHDAWNWQKNNPQGYKK
ncbi:UDP-glucose 4-epimerase GalE [Serratia rhizosphaerae]|uniref:UDP-glucose 4-epimerase n=1 Tax=Serratia rhizosphaerae TaxID=2597702 RepID=A0ABX6GI45_9GAMM|nr:UDP-glucose 4-epimerase GalE [Serratia rhizosphaerae]MEB6335153.1 UDP-glucose 4-epimerase GalE [Serratia rhizosphaerae]QHA85935.1 UDP-glucose 4-epimerase GalE [Serratia rhizosphaerae]